ncbi:adenosylcobinamide-phosphate synthase CbiB [Hominifimenecus sp. rT4P-3]|uniref:adenosylcobinamide-phosphate synthase CbiB n=1 Tax=Hominifimenecus sp. rT4P-3 TaxID=3242979 RepID=UPI003DA514B4
METAGIALLLGFLLDLLLGDPHFLWHPVRGIGWLISHWEKLLRKAFSKSQRGEMAGGILLVLGVIVYTLIPPAFLLWLAYRAGTGIGIAVETLFCYQLLAARSLRDESKKVYDALRQEGLPAGRKAVSMIVGRDTENLTEEGVVKAAVETVAENTSDGEIAPLLFMACGGALAGFFYKAVNTMDSMVGYQNEKYLFFGRAAARLDDVLNYIPSRLAAVLMTAACWLTGLDGRNAWKIYKRDRWNHASPNSAQTEAVMAGGLGVELAGDAMYFGVLHKKKTIGNPDRKIEPEDILRANRLMIVASCLGMAAVAAVKWGWKLLF